MRASSVQENFEILDEQRDKNGTLKKLFMRHLKSRRIWHIGYARGEIDKLMEKHSITGNERQ